jgi:RNA polymerase sigma factor (sigma-70 family)
MQKDLENIFYTAFEDNKDRVFRICRSYAIDHDQAQDIFQEVLMNIWKSLPSFRAQSHINTWVYRITINTCLKARAFNEKRKINSGLCGVYRSRILQIL